MYLFLVRASYLSFKYMKGFSNSNALQAGDIAKNSHPELIQQSPEFQHKARAFLFAFQAASIIFAPLNGGLVFSVKKKG
jgi:hypothetical protein